MNPLKCLCWAALLLAGLSGVAGAVTPEDIAVLSAVVRACAPDSERVVLSDIPAELPHTSAAAEQRMGLPAHIPLRDELAARSHEEGRWPAVDLGASVRVIAGEQLADGTPWMQVSRPAFSADRMQALVYLSYTCGARCGAGEYVTLTRSGSGWVITQKYLESIA